VNNSYKNKYFSILGDSISTFEGYSKPWDAVFYDRERKYEAAISSVEETWWGRIIEHLGGELLVNDSISGSLVSKHPLCISPTYGCSDERTADLGEDGRLPDVILVFMGLNDRGYRVKLLPTGEEEERDLSVFSVAYREMLGKLRRLYPQAEIWCFTLPVSAFSAREDFVFSYQLGERHIDEYCEVIRAAAKLYGCRVMDLYRWAVPYDTIDGLHPNGEGMKALADAVIDHLSKGGAYDH